MSTLTAPPAMWSIQPGQTEYGQFVEVWLVVTPWGDVPFESRHRAEAYADRMNRVYGQKVTK